MFGIICVANKEVKGSTQSEYDTTKATHAHFCREEELL